MGNLILMNDVFTDDDEAGLLPGSGQANSTGNLQADQIAEFFWTKVKEVDLVFSSDADRIKKLVHKIRTGSKDQSLTSGSVRRLSGLRERDFGVLSRTPLYTDSEIFSHSRIKPDKGESVFECRVRVINCILELVNKYADKVILLVSHPFICQIALNAILQRDHTLLSAFWQDKGSFVCLGFEGGKYGMRWEFKSGYNALSNTSYTEEQIYSRLFGKSRALSF